MEKQRAAELRHTLAHEKKKQTYLLIDQLKVRRNFTDRHFFNLSSQEEWTQEKMELHENLEYQFRENLMEMGKSHKEAAEQVREEQRPFPSLRWNRP